MQTFYFQLKKVTLIQEVTLHLSNVFSLSLRVSLPSPQDETEARERH